MRTPFTSPGSPRRVLRSVAVVGVLALLFTACAGDDEPGGSDSPSPTESEPTDEPTESESDSAMDGCGEAAVTDPSNLSADRAVARCDEGWPKPQPLEERQTIRMSSAFKAEFVAPALLADALGEFEKENLDFEFVELGFSDALSQIATGDIDIAVGGTEAALFNANANDIDVRWALANFFPPDAGDTSEPQTGLWARRDVFSDPENPDIAELEGKKLASAVGLGSVIAYPIAQALEPSGVSLLDVTVERVSSPEMVTALENEAVDAAWLLDPYWLQAAENDDLVLLATQPPGEPIGGYYYGGHLFDGEKRDAALAWTRAVIRTINTYLAGDYQADDEVMAALAEATGSSVDSLALTPSLVFDWEIREGTTDRIQAFFIEFDTVEYEEPIAEDELVDRSLYLEAVGAG